LEELFAQLADILLQESALYRRILELSKKKTDVIIKGDTAELDSITGIEQDLIYDVSALEKRRESMIREKIQKCSGMSSFNTLSDIISHAPKHCRQQLSSARDELWSMLEELSEVNALNSGLIKSNLEYVNHILGRLQGSAGAYDMDGARVKGDLDASVLDKKV